MCANIVLFHPQTKVGRVAPDTDKTSTATKPTRSSPPSQHDTRTEGMFVKGGGGWGPWRGRERGGEWKGEGRETGGSRGGMGTGGGRGGRGTGGGKGG